MTDWTTVSALATAGGTLLLAVATFSSTRSANHAAAAAERSRQESQRPLLVTSRLQDPAQKVRFRDGRWFKIDGGRGAAEVVEGETVQLAISIRNVGRGLAVLLGWDAVDHNPMLGAEHEHRDPEDFRMLRRDLYVAPDDCGFWQGAVSDVEDPMFELLRSMIVAPRMLTVDVLYGDGDGGQRAITRFTMTPTSEFHPTDEDDWVVSVVRHWNIDRPDPR